jgi:GT2 family glycosyltransferase
MISIILPVIRPKHINFLIEAIRENAGIKHEIVWAEDTEGLGAPMMVKQLLAKTEYDNVLFIADDTYPLKDFAKNAYDVMQTFPDQYGLVGLNDSLTQNPTHFLVHKKLLPEIGGEIFHCGYTHMYCDMELALRAKALGRYKWCKDARIQHLHPMFGQGRWDKNYERVYSQETYLHDLFLFLKRNGHLITIDEALKKSEE